MIGIVKWFLNAVGFKAGAGGKSRNRIFQTVDIFSDKKGETVTAFYSSDVRIDMSLKPARLFRLFSSVFERSYQDLPLTRHIKKKFGQGDVFIDIGAHHGIFSFISSEAGYKVYAFEPMPDYYKFLADNNKYFDAYPYALSDAGGELDFFLGDGSNPSCSSLVEAEERGTGRKEGDVPYSGYSIKVRVARFDDVAREINIPLERIKLIKIDVESHELAVLKGMTGLFEKSLYPDICCEVERTTFTPVVEFMDSIGYYATDLLSGEKIREFISPCRRGGGCVDVLFVEKSQINSSVDS
jgi:FkbM family methyltransferase